MKPGDVMYKDPGADLDFEFDWTHWLNGHEPDDTLAATSKIVVSSDVEALPLLVIHDDAIDDAKKKHKFWAAAGTLGVRYAVTSQIVTESDPPRKDERTGYIVIRER